MSNKLSGTVRVGYVQALLDYAEKHFDDARSKFPANLLFGLDRESPNERIPVQQWSDLLNHAIQFSGDTSLPLRVAEELLPRHWGVFAYAAMSCATLAEVVMVLVRYERLIDEINDTKVHFYGDRASLEWIPRCEEPTPAFMQLSVTSWAIFAKRYTSRPDLIADVHFTFPEPKDVQTYQRIFGGKVLFGQKTTQLIFPISYLQIPITHHDADAHRILMLQIEKQFLDFTLPNDFYQHLNKTIFQQISRGSATLENVANAMGLTPRSLQYKLSEVGATYRELLDEVQLSLAHKYLLDKNISLVDVAFLLGYSEQSAFQKAFKRWSNETPGAFRKRLLKAAI